MDIEADTLTLIVGNQAGTEADSLQTKLNNLQAQSGSSTIVVENKGDLTILGTGVIAIDQGTIIIRSSDSLQVYAGIDSGTSGGTILLDAQRGDVILGASVTATGGEVTITAAQGIINSARSGITNVNGQTLHLIASGAAIGTAESPVTTNVSSDGNVSAEAGTDVNLTETDGDLRLSTVVAPNGDIYLQAETGSIVDALDDDTPTIQGGILTLTAINGGVGEIVDPLETVVDALVASASNWIIVGDEGNLSIVGDGLRLVNAGTVMVYASEALEVAAPVSLETEGSFLRLEAGQGDLAILNAVTSADSSITLIGQESVTQGLESEVRNTDGTIDVIALSDSITQEDGALITTGSAGGDIRLQAAFDITLGSVDSGTGSVSLIASAGAILDGGDSNIDVAALGLVANAERRVGVIGNNADALEVAVDLLSASSGSGGINFLEVDDVMIGDVSVNVSRVAFDGNSSDVAENYSDLRTSENGSVELRTISGSITVEDGTTLDNEIGVSADGSGTVTLDGAGDGAGIIVNADVRSGTGQITLTAGDSVTQVATANVVTTGGDILVRAPNGLIDLGDLTLGNSTGLLTIDGDQTIAADQSVVIRIGGLTPGSSSTDSAGAYDQMVVTGQANLDGTLEVTLVDGFLPEEGDVFDIVSFGSVDGNFADAKGLFGFGNDNLYLEVVELEDGLQLVTRVQPSVDQLNITTSTTADNDTLGVFFNGGYFGYGSYEVDAAIVVSDFFYVEGHFFLENDAGTYDLSNGKTAPADFWSMHCKDTTY
ncbi:MAG TPA: hypothetical protein EYQ50_22995 [Verrucomicrobiales bacterium]|nr:hypothetical protein [Verrucomicrobiales bacterium]